MVKPSYECRLDNMISSQRKFIIEAAYGDYKFYLAAADIYHFNEKEAWYLRRYIRNNYDVDDVFKQVRQIATFL